MIRFEEALALVLPFAAERELPVERVSLRSALGRILREDVFSDMDMPPFDKSAVDGFACRTADISRPLRVIETIAAGAVPRTDVGRGECSRIMTGAMVPAGADRVVMVEHTEPAGENTVMIKDAGAGTNICRRGEDIRKGDLALGKGARISPAHIAVLATTGNVTPMVSCLPGVGIISTGDELVEPETVPGTAQIRNSNASQLEAQVMTLPATPSYYGIIPDESSGLRHAINQSLGENDIILLSGGVSMGDFDLVPQIMKEAGVEILFRKIAVQPGKPTVFGHRDKVVIFGLPGNPVSSFVIFELLVRPFMLRMAGYKTTPARLMLPAGSNYTRRNDDRLALVPIALRDGAVYPVEYHGSAHINAFSAADGIMFMDIGKASVKQGESVHVRLI